MRPYRHLAAILATAVPLLATAPANAHPHMLADARLDVNLSADKETIVSLRHIWRFDEVSSSMMLVDLDQNGDLTLDEAELTEASKIMMESLAEFNYFQIVTADGKDVVMNPPSEIKAVWEDNLLYVMLETTPKEPFRLAGKIDLGVYDPTFYVAIDFAEDDKMVVASLPDTCARQVIRPDADEALAQNQATLDQAFKDDSANTDMSKIFATKLELTCQASG
jgi:ABC-type uncharacterized transport system substrate-binding protein